MNKRKWLTLIFSLLVLASLVGSNFNVSAMPASPTDESKVPHYFGPYPNWANSPFTLPNATVAIQGDGIGAAAVALVDPVTQGIASIQVTSPGGGYTTANVVISGGDGLATADAVINASGSVTSVTVDAQGAGYTAPIVSFDGGGGTGAAGTAYGSVDQVTLTDPGMDYTFPTVDFDLPDAPDGVPASAHVMCDDGFGAPIACPSDGSVVILNSIVVDDPGSGYLTAPGVAIHNGTLFDPIAGATPASASTTLKVTSVTVDTFGSGYTSAPNVLIDDPTGVRRSCHGIRGYWRQ